MEIHVSRSTLTVVCILVVVCSANAMNYLAFPRMGRSENYLAFPRMGRSQAKADTVSDSCCALGLKGEYAIGRDGKEEQLRSFCANEEPCCHGLTEEVMARTNGVFYSVCVPDTSAQNSQFGSLKNLLRRK